MREKWEEEKIVEGEKVREIRYLTKSKIKLSFYMSCSIFLRYSKLIVFFEDFAK